MKISAAVIACCVGLLLTCRTDVMGQGNLAKARIPDAASVATAKAMIHDLFKDDYAKTGAPNKLALAGKLIAAAKETSNDPASRYVLLTEAIDNAAAAGDLDTTYSTISQIDDLYIVRIHDLQLAAIPFLSKLGSPSTLASAAIVLSQELIADDDPAGAKKASSFAISLAGRQRNRDLVARAAQQDRIADQSQRARLAAASAKEQLARNDQDPAANLAEGRYLCFTLHRFEQGAAFLAKTDGPLAAIGKAEIAPPADGTAMHLLAEAWWNYAVQKPEDATPAKVRAAFWYERSLPGLSGLEKIAVEKRIAEALEVMPLQPVTWELLRQPVQMKDGQFIFPEGSGVITTSVAVSGNWTLSFEQNPDGNWGGTRLRFNAAKKSMNSPAFDLALWADHPGEFSTTTTPGVAVSDFSPPEHGSWAKVVVRVQRGHIEATIDGKQFLITNEASISPDGYLLLNGNRSGVRNIALR